MNKEKLLEILKGGNFGVEDRYINYQSFMKKYKKRLEKGLKMFIEYYRCFWW